MDENEARLLLPDPQTNGGLLIAVDEKAVDEVKEIFTSSNLQSFLEPIGKCVEKREKVIYVK
jgi:selenide, water dikinase